MVEARWRGLLNSWQHWGTISHNTAHKHTDADRTDRWCVSPWNHVGKAADTREWTCLYKQERNWRIIRNNLHVVAFAFLSDPEMNSSTSERKIKRERKGKRSEARKRGERGQKGRLWTMVSNQRTLVQWWMLPFNNQSFWGGGRGGASCWQCQGPYQLVLASATETNDRATALLYVCTAEGQTHTHSQYCVACTVSSTYTISVRIYSTYT